MERKQQLQALRAIAYISIFLSHCGITKFGGAWGVSVFLILSGFLMSYNYLDKTDELSNYSLKKCLIFSMSKIKKLYALHLIMTMVALPMLLLNLQEINIVTVGKTILKIILNVLLVQAWFPVKEYRYSMNNLSWYLSVCLFLYFMFPYIVRIMRKYTKKYASIFMCIIVYFIMVLIGSVLCGVCYKKEIDAEIVKGLTYNFPVYRLGEFFIGCNIGYLFRKRNETNKRNYSLLEIITCMVIVLCFIVSTKCSEDVYNTWWRTTVLYTWSTVLLVYLVTVNKGIISKIINNKVLIYIGNLSAYTYLIHEMPILYLNKYTSTVYSMRIDKWLMALMMFPLAFIAAYAWKRYVVERKTHG